MDPKSFCLSSAHDERLAQDGWEGHLVCHAIPMFQIIEVIYATLWLNAHWT